MKCIFQQTAKFPRGMVNERGEAWVRPNIYRATFAAYYAPKQHVLLCIGTVQSYQESNNPEPWRRLIDIAGHATDHQAWATRSAIEHCDMFFSYVRDWCVDNSEYPVADSAAEAAEAAA